MFLKIIKSFSPIGIRFISIRVELWKFRKIRKIRKIKKIKKSRD